MGARWTAFFAGWFSTVLNAFFLEKVTGDDKICIFVDVSVV